MSPRAGVSLRPARWRALREAWQRDVASRRRAYVGRDVGPGLALAAAENDEWRVVAVGEEGDAPAEYDGAY